MSASVSLVVMAPGWGALAAGTLLAANALAAYQRRYFAEQARLSFARAGYAALGSRVADAQARFPDAVSDLPPPPARDNPAAEITELEGLVAAGERRLGSQLAAARVAALAASLRDALAGPAAGAAGPSAGGPAGPHRPAPATDGWAGAVDDAGRVLGRLDPTVPPPTRADLDARARHLLAAPPARRDPLLDDLRLAVAAANAEASRVRSALADLRERAIAAGADADDVGLPLFPIATGPATAADPTAVAAPDWDRLRAAVDAATEAAAARAERAYAAAALRESLEEIGCEVEESFDTLVVRGDVAVLRPAERSGPAELTVLTRMSERGLRFDATPANAATPADATTPADESGQPDEADQSGAASPLARAEREWCDDVEALVPALARRGIPVEIVSRTAISEADALPAPAPRSARGRFRARPSARRPGRATRGDTGRDGGPDGGPASRARENPEPR
jgi:hypothetical protein